MNGTGSPSYPLTITSELQLDGTPVNGSQATATVQAAGGTNTITSTALITVSSAPQTLTVENDTADAAYTNAKISVKKLT